MDQSNSPTGTDRPLSRRTVLGSLGVASLGAIAGCLDDDAEVPDPVTIDDDHECEWCTMVISQHPGPVGQAHYEEPTELFEEDRPGYFCSSLCTYAFTFDNEAEAEPEVIYLTDYSLDTVDWEVEDDQGALVLSRHLEADTFSDVDDLTMVVDSEVQGAMGDSIVGFNDGDDADDFADEYGGDIYDHDEISQELVMSLM
ncbi:nitrous oxide reductase accessory protein NosL [Natronolimnohabitans sp. A-GB9]|uniref:nitrous oxide reductase accessory protein NosL n=1 Tax=Natronolimnohabitans sp. A-GB9 TaxID=3069757 RepID=UPI0027B6B1E2|nr:nitrous oxide reductase accessory protein NosL [Natronolimnohabitans sp. A-GB9]MDQ2049993.1 nitrous oxide reductase accessory protein NosL [Natronolimnohabitans sp. A-GB9]